jgi:hypothetical protein
MAVKIPIVVTNGQFEQIQSGDTISLPNGSIATTQTAGDNSTKVATTAYVQSFTNRTFAKSVINSSITGTVTETILGSILIPANTIGIGQILDIRPRFTKTGTAGSWTPRIRIHTSSAVAGNIIYAQSGVAASNFASLHKIGLLKSTTTSTSFGAVSNQNDDSVFITATNAEVSYTIDWTIDQYILFTMVLGNTGDTGTLSGYIISIY